MRAASPTPDPRCHRGYTRTCSWAGRSSAPGHVNLCPPGAKRSVLTAVFHVCGHSHEWPSCVGKSRGSTVSHMSEASRWWAVKCGPTRSTVRSRYTHSAPPQRAGRPEFACAAGPADPP